MPASKTIFKGLLLAAFFSTLLLGIFSAYVAYWYSHPADHEASGKSFFVEKGWSVQTIAQEMASENLMSNPSYFVWITRLFGSSTRIHAGEYQLSASMTPAAILDKFLKGDVLLHQVTLPEGITSYQVVQILGELPELQGKIDEIPAEGSLLPETYSFHRGMSPQEVLNDISGDMKQVVDEVWQKRPSDSPLSSKEELVTLASIVEKETALPQERPVVAAVFLNRLKIGMPLQADPTVVYGLTEGKGALGRRLLRKDLEAQSPYNTYLNPGLPPTPIANPGRSSLEAVMAPAAVDYLYFVADGSGGHVFASTLEEHNKNHATWRKVRQQQERVQSK